MDNGNWVIGGENHWDDAAVAISDGDDLTKWKMVTIPRPEAFKVLWPESAIINQGNNKLLALCRPHHFDRDQPYSWTAPVSESSDGGETWSPLGRSNFPLAPSQPFAGRLSTGHNYLLTNSREEARCLLSIALTDAKGGPFRHIFKLRHQQWPKTRLFANNLGKPTEWAYPSAVEYDGNLYIAYSQAKEDCVLSIIPVDILANHAAT
jgi:hypothetical protein